MPFSKYRVPCSQRAYKVSQFVGSDVPWRVVFFVDGVEVGGAQFQSPEQADEAGVEFMFSGWGDQ